MTRPAGAARSGCARHRTAGFTLVEVMVALGIVAIALVAGMKATAALTYNAARQSDMLLAQACAENALVAVRLQAQLPDLGNTTQTCTQAGQQLEVALTVAPTPNPNFRRVDVQVRRGAEGVMGLSTVVGRY
jgi:general secretion pathway protein I